MDFLPTPPNAIDQNNDNKNSTGTVAFVNDAPVTKLTAAATITTSFVHGSGKGIDAHPFTRGSVIEVLYVDKKKSSNNNKRKGKKNPTDNNHYYFDEYYYNFYSQTNYSDSLPSSSLVLDSKIVPCCWHENDDQAFYSRYHRLNRGYHGEEESDQEEDDSDGWVSTKSDSDDISYDEKEENYDVQDDEIFDKGKTTVDTVSSKGMTNITNPVASISTTDTFNTSKSIKKSEEKQEHPQIYLCDIIDRISITNNETNQKIWKYYVHYRNLNRRMDEWITVDRIVSPPSVGNAKVRALKRKKDEEEKERLRRERVGDVRKKPLDKRTSRNVMTMPQQSGALEGAAAEKELDTTYAPISNSPSGSIIGSTTAATSSEIASHDISPLSGMEEANRRISARKRLRRTICVGGNTEGYIETGGDPSNVFVTSEVAVGGSLTDTGTYATDVAITEHSRLTRRQRRKTADNADIITLGGGLQQQEQYGVIGAAGSETLMGLTRAGSFNTGAIASSSVGVTAEEHLAVDVVTTIAAPILDEHEGMDEAALKEHEEVTKIKNVATLELGQYQMDTWYFSPLPKELFSKDGGGNVSGGGGMIDVLYVDEFSFNFFTRKSELLRYQARELPKNRRHPPGNEIYRCGNLSMFEVDGFEERIYCQNLCYIAKLFLDHKTLYFDVDPFLFYILCELDERGYHPVGYYSKEKYSDVGYNLACILTFPSHQRKGYGRFLIAFSYELSKKEEKVGSPEKPMSDLGQQAYIPYWTSTIVDFLLNHPEGKCCKSMSIMDIAKQTSIMAEDIIFALNTLGILKFVNGVYFISAERSTLEYLAKKHPIKGPQVDPSKLHWTPYLTDVKRDKFSISSKKSSVEVDVGNSCGLEKGCKF